MVDPQSITDPRPPQCTDLRADPPGLPRVLPDHPVRVEDGPVMGQRPPSDERKPLAPTVVQGEDDLLQLLIDRGGVAPPLLRALHRLAPVPCPAGDAFLTALEPPAIRDA